MNAGATLNSVAYVSVCVCVCVCSENGMQEVVVSKPRERPGFIKKAFARAALPVRVSTTGKDPDGIPIVKDPGHLWSDLYVVSVDSKFFWCMIRRTC